MIALIVGGTGTLAKNVLPLLIERGYDKIRLLSRGEHAQATLRDSLSESDQKRTRFLVGDCRDRNRMIEATRGVDHVFHFAAMKSVDAAEYNAYEAVLTNIEGTKNVLDACIANNVSRAIFTSTDKAVAPLNIYGASKLVAEKLWIQGNLGNHHTRFAVMRYGNVLGSQGSVIEKWAKAFKEGKQIQLTDPKMTRFFITPKEAARFVVDRSEEAVGGEIFVPKMKSTSMYDLAYSVAKVAGDIYPDITVTGYRPGEKKHEQLISKDEVDLTTDCGLYYIRWPNASLFTFTPRGRFSATEYDSFVAERLTETELIDMIEEVI